MLGYLPSCYAGTIDPGINDTRYLEYGQDFVHIGQLIGTDNQNIPWTGSCVAINDRLILTAAHLFHDAKSCNVKINNKEIKVETWIVHKDFSLQKLGHYDIAIGLLEETVGLDWYPDLYENTDEQYKVCSIAGYGATGTFETGPHKFDNKLRAGSNIIDKHDRGVLVCSASLDQGKTELEFLIAPGDSGGGLFINNRLAGINSAILRTKINGKLKNEYFSEGIHTRVSDHAIWVKEQKTILLHKHIKK